MGRINCLEDIFPKVTHSSGICNLEALLQDLGLTFLVQRVNKQNVINENNCKVENTTIMKL